MRWRRWFTRKREDSSVIEGVSLNDDFTDRHTDVPEVLAARHPAWIGVQEGKRHDYARVLDEQYDVTQDLTSDATAGVAVIVDLEQVTPIGRAVNDPSRLGHGWQELTPAGRGILARGVAWRDVRINDTGRVVRLASTHRLPKRAADGNDEFDARLERWLATSPLPVWLVADFNTPAPDRIRTRGRKRLARIDGHLITGRLRYKSRPRLLRRRTSDHRPVTALVRIPPRPRHRRPR